MQLQEPSASAPRSAAPLVAERHRSLLHLPHPFNNKPRQVLFMTVNCGYGGQAFQPAVLQKVAALRAAHPWLCIQVDGGINASTAALAAAAGANAVVAGTAVFRAPGGPAAAIQELRAALVEHLPAGLAAAGGGAAAGAGAAAAAPATK